MSIQETISEDLEELDVVLDFPSLPFLDLKNHKNINGKQESIKVVIESSIIQPLLALSGIDNVYEFWLYILVLYLQKINRREKIKVSIERELFFDSIDCLEAEPLESFYLSVELLVQDSLSFLDAIAQIKSQLKEAKNIPSFYFSSEQGRPRNRANVIHFRNSFKQTIHKDLDFVHFRIEDRGFTFTFPFDFLEIGVKEFEQVLADHLECFLKNINTLSKTPLSQVSLVRQGIKILSVHSPVEELKFGLLELFEEQVVCCPYKVAVRDTYKSYTFQELEDFSTQISHFLHNINLSHPAVVVAICCDRSYELIALTFAVLKLNGIFLPIDPANPQQRIEYIINDARPNVIIILEKYKHLFNFVSSDTRLVVLEEVIGLSCLNQKEKNVVSQSLNSSLYILYTSGTSGTPKGVIGTQIGVLNRLHWMWEKYPFRPNEVCCLKTSFSFVDSIWEIFGPILKGITLVIIPNEILIDIPALIDTIEREQITRFVLVPSLLQMILEQSASLIQRFAKQIRVCISSGEALTRELLCAFFTHASETILLNLYGSTEVAADATFKELSQDDINDRYISIGRPISNMEAFILDEENHPVPAGVIGELYIAGVGLAHGYLNKQELTKEKFPYLKLAQGKELRVFKTGDLVRYTPKGDIQYIGRSDNQVKIRGHRVELEEIDANLRKHPQIQHATTLYVTKPLIGKSLVSFVVIRPSLKDLVSSEEIREELRKHTSQQLPSYMVPNVFVFLDDMPLTVNGKIARQKLQRMSLLTSSDSDEPLFFSSETERDLYLIWSEVLPNAKISCTTNFFYVGGHSLLAAKVLARAQALYQIQIPLKLLFQHPTLASFAVAIEKLKGTESIENFYSEVQKKTIENAATPLSSTQLRLWFAEQLLPNTAVYNLPQAFSLFGPLDEKALFQALERLFLRHEILRTIITGGLQPFQVVQSNLSFPVNQYDFSGLDEVKQNDLINFHITQEVNRPFSFYNTSLIRCLFIKLSSDRHILVINMHHIISDGWSLEIFNQELSKLYNFLKQGQSKWDIGHNGLPDLAIQHSDYVFWLARWQNSGVLDKQFVYWKDQLQDLPEPIRLPAYKLKLSSKRVGKGNVWTKQLTSSLASSLKEFAKRNQSTIFTVLYATLNVLLFRYSGKRDIIIGTLFANRPRKELETLIGFFANLIPLRLKCNPTENFLELLAKAKKLIIEAHENQDIPFGRLAELLRESKEVDHQDLLPFIIVFENIDQLNLTFDEIVSNSLPFSFNYSKFDCTLLIREHQGNFELNFEYALDLFDLEFIKDFAFHFEQTLCNCLEYPEKPINTISIVSVEDMHKFLNEWNPALEYASLGCLHQLFERSALQFPDRIAAVYGETSMTYEELNRKANGLARHLQTLAHSSHLIAICLDRGLEQIISILGVLKAGYAYVPLDPNYPHERLEYIFKDTQVETLITLSYHENQFKDFFVNIIIIDELTLSLSTDNLSQIIDPHSLAYIIYTSGSTGAPKGVGISHANVVRLFQATYEAFKFNFTDVWTLFHSFAFDFSVWEMWGALLYGGKLVIVPFLVSRSPDAFSRLIVQEKVTILNQTPSAFYPLSQCILQQPHSSKLNLRIIVFGGESLDFALLRPWISRYGFENPELINMYGITETTVHVTYCKLSVSNFDLSRGSLIGKPLSDLKLYILDENRLPVPVGVVGELYIGGPGLAAGYFQRPDLTRDRFLANPFGTSANDRIYKTGDLATFCPDGNVVYLGRKDRQVKVRGFRIELGEIEYVLEQHPDVGQAVAISKDSKLTVYVVLKQQSKKELHPSELKSYLKSKLLDYMIPNHILFLDQLPLTFNGKIDYASLPVSNTPQSLTNSLTAEVFTDLQRKLSVIWEDVLKKTSIGLSDNFFDLGGHSLLAIQLIDKINQNFGINLPLNTLFLYSNLDELTKYIESARPGSHGPLCSCTFPQMIHDPQNSEAEFPLTDIQQAYLIGRSGAIAFGNISAYSYTEYDYTSLDIKTLEKAWNQLIWRHEALRLVFHEADAQKIVSDPPYYRFKINDFRSLSLDQACKALERIRYTLSHQVLPADQWPLFEIQISLYDTKIRMHFCVDALILDAWSENIIFNEWAKLYRNGNAFLRPTGCGFRDYVIANQKIKDSEIYYQHKNYWMERIGQFPLPPELPTNKIVGQTSTQFDRLSYTFKSEQWNIIKNILKENKLPSGSFLITLYAICLSNWSRYSHFVINLTTFNRLPLHEDINHVTGDFTSLTLLEVDLASLDGLPFISKMRHIHEQLWKDLEHKLFNGIEVIREINKSNKENITQIYPVVFTSMLGIDYESDEHPLKFGSLSFSEVYGITQTPQVWLDFKVYERGGDLVLEWDYLKDIFPHFFIEEMFESYVDTLNGFARDKLLWDEPYFNLLPRRQHLLRHQINQTQCLVPPPQLLHELFYEQAKLHPDHIAVIQEEIIISYKRLEQMSLGLAVRMLSLELRPNLVIAVLMQKGWEQVVAVLGILKSGFTYLPVDPNLPQARIEQLLECAEVSAVITQPQIQHFAHSLSYLQKLPAENILFVDVQMNDNLSQNIVYPLILPESLAYIIFTSGSTGQPKGVMISHQSAVNTIWDINTRFSISSKDRVLALSNLNFDLSVYDIFGLLAVGGAIVVPKPENLREPKAWLHLIQRYRITVWNSVPAFIKMFVEFLRSHSDYSVLMNDPVLQLILMSGDWIPLDLPSQISQFLVNVDDPCFKGIISLGGATEAAIWSIIYPIWQVSTTWKSIPYGKPLKNQQVYVLHKDFSSCPDGVVGDIFIGGIGLAIGYWKDPKKTDQSFIYHPRTRQRLYKTGDVGRYLQDGNIELLGRDDFQMKINGHRVELEEIEYYLRQYPHINQAIAQVIRQQDKDLLVAFVSCEKLPVEEYVSISENIEYKLNRFAFLQDPHQEAICLGNEASGVSASAIFARKSYRSFRGGPLRVKEVMKWLRSIAEINIGRSVKDSIPISFKMLATILSNYRAVCIESSLLPKYRYPSAGSLYPVYICAKINGVSNISNGIYSYNSLSHQLTFINNHVFHSEDKASVTLYFLGRHNVIEPIYGREASVFCQIEAGYMLGLLNIICREEKCALDITFHLDEPEKKSIIQNLELEKGNEPICKATLGFTDEREVGNTCQSEFLDIDPYVFIKSEVEDFDVFWQRLELKTGKVIISEVNPNDKDVEALFSENVKLFKEASVGILFGLKEKENIAPGDFLKVGFLSQYLMENGLTYSIGMCPIGKVNGDGFKDKSDLKEILHALLVGPIEKSQIQDTAVSVPTKTSVITEQALITHLAKMLPSYMIPRRILIIEQFPLSVNGKVNRSALVNLWEQFLSDSKEKNVAPRSAIEEQLMVLFSEILKVKMDSIHTNFFHAGGNSILAVKTVGALNQLFHKKISVMDFFNHSTVSELARLLNSKFKAPEILFHVTGKLNRHNFFLAPPVSGLSFCYVQLRSYIKSLNIIGFNNPCFGDPHKRFTSIEEMAAVFIRAMKQVQPQGPYLLGGWSFGGVIAYEMAQQLRANSDEIENVIMFDAYNSVVFDKNRMSLQVIQEDLAEEGIVPESEEGKYFRLEVENNWNLFMEYRPKYYGGRVCVIKAQGDAQIQSLDDLYNGWNKVISENIELYSVPGTHGKMFFRDRLGVLAKRLQFIIENPLKHRRLDDGIELDRILELARQCNDLFLIEQINRMKTK